MTSKGISREDKFGMMVTAALHVVLIVFALLYTINTSSKMRPAFIEVTLGQFQSGTPAEYAKQKKPKVATRPNPSDVEPEKPKEKTPEKVQKEQNTTKDPTKDVNLAEQKEEVESEPVKTPETDKVDPEKEKAKQEKEDVTVAPKTEKDEVKQEGAKTSGDKKGNKGELNADQGTGNEENKSAPYNLKWEGDLERDPILRPLPTNTADQEAVITVRFEVKPDGTVGRIVPLKKMNPELERQVMSTLRSWRFSRLPSGVPQESQWGVITFRFVLD